MIRPWRAEDASQLAPLILEFLRETDGDLLPTPRSAQALLQMGLDAVQRGDPCLVAEDEGGRIVGYVLWHGPTIPADTKGVVLQGQGTYVIPFARDRGIGTALWKAAIAQSWQRGYTRIVTVTRREDTLAGVGFRPMGHLMTLERGG